jgi:hypothetical protein
MSNKYSIYSTGDTKEIITYLQLGTKIPNLYDFYDTIYHDLEYFSTQAWIVKDEGNPIGFCLIFYHNSEELYFGFFNILDHNEFCIEFLIQELKKYAEKNGFQRIRGPINIPTIIFGWGFMEAGSRGDLFIGKPLNPPIYQKLFLKQGFLIRTRQNTWEGKIPNLKPFLTIYDLSKYEFFNFQSWEKFDSFIDQFFLLSAKNLDPESVLTPCIDKLFPNYINFTKMYGKEFFFSFARVKKTKEMVGTIACLPNPFRKNFLGKLDSFVIFSIAVNKIHRKNGIGWGLLDYVFTKAYRQGINFMSAPIESTQDATKYMSHKGELQKSRSHIILEYKVE